MDRKKITSAIFGAIAATLAPGAAYIDEYIDTVKADASAQIEKEQKKQHKLVLEPISVDADFFKSKDAIPSTDSPSPIIDTYNLEDRLLEKIWSKSADEKYTRSLKNQKTYDGLEKVMEIADDPFLVSAIIMQESEFVKNPRPYGKVQRTYGIAQIKYKAFIHCKAYFKNPRDETEKQIAESIKGITWKKIKGNDISAQVKILEAYLHITRRVLEKRFGSRIGPDEMNKFVYASWNIGPNAVIDAVSAMEDTELTWEKASGLVCSKRVVDKHLGFLDKKSRKRKPEITRRYVERCDYFEKRLKNEFGYLKVATN